MSDFDSIMATATSGMRAQSTRLRLTAENVANADTPGYRRKTVTFAETVEGGARMVSPEQVLLDRSDLPRIYDPAHPMADAEGYYLGSTVDLVIEIADSREARRSFEANLRLYDQARSMAAGVLDLIRR